MPTDKSERRKAESLSGAAPTNDAETLEAIRGTLFAALEMKEPSLDKCERSAFEMATIASNGIYWRNREIKNLREKLEALEAPSMEKAFQGAIRELVFSPFLKEPNSQGCCAFCKHHGISAKELEHHDWCPVRASLLRHGVKI